MRLIIRNGLRLDVDAMEFLDDGPIVVDDGIIVAIGETASADREVDARGSFMLPGFVDAHVHFRLASLDFGKLARWSEVEYGIAMARLARETLARGFTSVRDLGGDVEGLIGAIGAGMAQGPRIRRAGRMLTQTGGHGDAEAGPRPVPECACEMRHTAFGIVADGADAVRKAARHNLRDGSDFLKIHVSGGVASPSDPLESIQYTAAEIAAACEEARHRQTYVAAHAYSAEAIRLAVENGVHSIEHGNLIDDDAARAMASAGAVLVPTLATYEAMNLLGRQIGLPAANFMKNEKVLQAGLSSLEVARRAGVTMGFGTDLIGESQNRQRREFAIRAEVEPPRDILRSMFVVNPRLLQLQGKVGTLSAGAFGDILLTKVNPLEDVRKLADEHIIEKLFLGGHEVEAA